MVIGVVIKTLAILAALGQGEVMEMHETTQQESLGG
jgi:hypothetical protein